MSKVKVLQFKNKRNAMEVINGMDTDELKLKRNKVAGQYVVYPTSEDGEGALTTFVMIAEGQLEISEVKEDILVDPEDYEGTVTEN